jgi:hypothetical protein
MQTMSKKFRRTAAVIVLLALAACAGPPPPTYNTDPFKGIYNQSAAAVPAGAPVALQHPVGIILGDNFELWLGAVKAADEYWSARVPSSLTNTVVQADANPTFLASRVLESLKRHFPEASVVNDFQQAVASGKKGVVLVDVLPKVMEAYGDRTTKFDITYYFFDATMNPVSKISGHGEEYRPIGAMDAGIQYSVDQALGQLDQKMAAVVR